MSELFKSSEARGGREGVFPISPEATNIALGIIAQDPMEATLDEAAILEQKNPVLSNYLQSNVQVRHNPMVEHSMMEGIMHAHRILRTNAQLRKEELPTISEDMADMMLADNIDRLRDSGISIKENYMQMWDAASNDDPELVAAFDEITKYRVDRSDVLGGAAYLILAFKKAEEAKDFERSFNG